MSNVVDFPKAIQNAQQVLRARHQNGGTRGAVMTIASHKPEDGDAELRADCFLAELWSLGFKVVPLDGSEQ